MENDLIPSRGIYICYFVRLLGLSVKLTSENILKKLLKIGQIIKINVDYDEVPKGPFPQTCVEVVITKPLQMELNYKRGNAINLCLLIMKFDICHGCGQQDHKFRSFHLFTKSFIYRNGENVQLLY